MKNNLATIFSWGTFLFAVAVVLIFEVRGIFAMSIGNDSFAAYSFLIVGNTLAAIGLYRALRNSTYSNTRGAVRGLYYAFLGQVYSFCFVIVVMVLFGFGR